MRAAGVKCTSTEALTGESPYGVLAADGPAFPRTLGPLALAPVSGVDVRLTERSYTIASTLPDMNTLAKTVGASHGPVSPTAALPAAWPGAPRGASQLCWAYPLEGITQVID